MSSITNICTVLQSQSSIKLGGYFPLDVIFTNDELKFFVTQCLDNPNYAHLFERSVFNHGFIFEEGGDDFLDDDTDYIWTNKGKLSIERWKVYMSHVHFAPQSRHQSYWCQNAEFPHYQTSFSALFEKLKLLETLPCTIHFYDPRRDHRNPFLVVWNVSSVPFQGLFDWRFVLRSLREKREKLEKKRKSSSKRIPMKKKKSSSPSRCGKVTRQPDELCIDWGFCGGMNSSRVGSRTGLSVPRLLEGTDDPSVKMIFASLSTVTRAMGVAGCFLAVSRRSHLQMLSDQIYPDCLLSTIRVTTTYPTPDQKGTLTPVPVYCPSFCATNLSLTKAVCTVIFLGKARDCNCHADRINGNPPCAVGFSSVIPDDNGEVCRIGVNGQGRKSLDDYCLKVLDYDKMLSDIVAFYKAQPEHRRILSPKLFQTGQRRCHIPGFAWYENKCSLDPFGFIQVVLDGVTRLTRHFNLNLIESHSLQMASLVIPHCHYFFGVACAMMLSLPRGQLPPKYQGIEIGWCVANMNFTMWETWRKDPKTKQTCLRYNAYRVFQLPSKNVFFEKTRYHLNLCIAFTKIYGNATAKLDRVPAYSILMRKIDDHSFKGVGDLGCHHSVNASATLGFLPKWTRHMAEVRNVREWVPALNSKYELEKPLDKGNLPSFLDSLTARLLNETDDEITNCKAENVSCKFTQHEGDKSSNKFRDGIMEDSLVVKDVNGLVVAMYEDGRETTVGDFLLPGFPFRDSSRSMSEIADKVGSGWVQLPSDSMLQSFVLLSKVVHARGRVRFLYNMREKKPPSGEAALKTIEVLEKVLGEKAPRHTYRYLNL